MDDDDDDAMLPSRRWLVRYVAALSSRSGRALVISLWLLMLAAGCYGAQPSLAA